VNTRTHKQGSRIIVYDDERIQQPGKHLFSAEAWERSGCVVGQAPGRGSAQFLETDFGPAVLRHYLRGGWAARFSRDRYLYTGAERSRPMAEFNLLVTFYALGLPVPQPLAAQFVKHGLFYSGDLLTRRIPDVIPLAELSDSRRARPEAWHAVGACIRSFHDHGIIHADLNARNILLGGDDRVYLIDFDRAQIRKGATSLFQANLRRLKRSLHKFLDEQPLEYAWRQLLYGYDAGPGERSVPGPDGCGSGQAGVAR
jgi:3-deoxy-D-manno-octulosonic acid kinase